MTKDGDGRSKGKYARKVTRPRHANFFCYRGLPIVRMRSRDRVEIAVHLVCYSA